MTDRRWPHLTDIGRPAVGLGTPVNPAVTRASTLLFDRAEDLYRTDVRGYGRHGSTVHDALKLAIGAIEGGDHVSLAPSGLAACTLAILACVKAGDHVLVTDSIYGPTRAFAQTTLKRFGVGAEFYDPRADITPLLRDNTSLVVLESPGSLTLEIQDIPAIVAATRPRGIRTVIDNTWSAGLTFRPLDLGVDISVQAATKYYSGHSDVLMGAVISRDETVGREVAAVAKQLGHATSPDDAYLVLRGIRTLIQRFEQAEATSEALARAVDAHPGVAQVFHPALATHPDHTLWQKQFSGGGCLFSFTLKDRTEDDAVRFVTALTRFGIGYSYGGYESLAIHCGPQLRRNHPTPLDGPLIRLACGLESADDLIADVTQALNSL